MTSYVKKPRSVSQINAYKKCPEAYRLARIEKVWQRPAAWLPQGTAVHAVGEVYRRRQVEGHPMTLEEAQELFGEEYAKACNEYCAITPNFQFWSRSGPYGGAQDIERRYKIGLEQVEKLINWFEANPGIEVWVAPDGTLGIELDFTIVLGMDHSCPVHVHGIKDDDCDCGVGPISVRGFIDAVVIEDGEVKVIDYKTGKNPGDDFQLGVYGVALQLMYGIEPPKEGSYWMGQSGKLTYPYDISEWTIDRVTEEFIWFEEKLVAGEFEADPEAKKCAFCDVNASCSFVMS